MKPYVKPELYYENFELAQHIAGCSLTLLNADVKSCAATGTINGVPSESWFVAEPTCGVTVEEYCYTGSHSNLATINS